MVYASGELSLIEYGQNEILGSCRTEKMKPTLCSVRINERPPKKRPGDHGGRGDDSRDNKKIAYLLDELTIRVLDLVTGYAHATVNHDVKIDWLELNSRADLLLYRDKRRQLHLYDIENQARSTLLTYCNYVQWVPGSDVVVGQNRGSLCVWYNIHAPEKVTTYEIHGEVEEIERVDGRTEVKVDEGITTMTYKLDEALIGFGSSVEDGDLAGAMDVLASQTNGGMEMTEETETMWKQLSSVALEAGNLAIAERCCSALGDMPKSRFLHKINKIVAQAEKAGVDGMRHWAVRAKLAQLRGDYREAELVYLEQGQVDDAIELYQSMHKWGEAIRVAEQRKHPEAAEMKSNYFDYLLSSGQEDKAGQVKENEGDHDAAIDLYLRGGRPAKALQLINNHGANHGTDTLERIAKALTRAKMYDKAGDLYEQMDHLDRALESYIKGHAFRPAVELARRAFPQQVVKLEQAWGDWLVSNKSMEAAINHYIEAGASTKAIEAAFMARQWSKAGQLVDALQAADPSSAKPYYVRIARHFQDTRNFKKAEKFFLMAGMEREAIEMYTEANLWDSAHKLAVRFMSEKEVSKLYTQQAQVLESKGKFKDAERLLLTIDEPDLAITMYKKARKYDGMIRLVTAYRKDLLKETHLHLAQQLEMDGAMKDAEHHYAEAGDWQSAVNMYRANDMWDEAIRVAKYHGGIRASKRVAYAWAVSLGGEAGSKLLTKLGLIEQAIDYAVESGNFDHAFELAGSSNDAKVAEVHLKYALFLEDEEKFTQAEDEFIKAEKPKEAIDMYIHQADWANAMRVAERYDPSSISNVLAGQAKVAGEQKDFTRAETLYINAKKPELAIAMYQDLDMWPQAMQFAKRHLPQKLQEVTMAYQRSVESGGSKGSGSTDAMQNAQMWEEARDYYRAIDAYLAITEEQAGSADGLVRAWERAIQVSARSAKDRYQDVVEDVAAKLVGIKRFHAAADLFKEVDRFKEAIDCYIKAKKWDDARDVCNMAPIYRDYVDKAYRSHLVKNEAADELVNNGEVTAALNLYCQQGKWSNVFAVIENDAPQLGAKYAGEYASRIFASADLGTLPAADVDDTISKLAKYGCPQGSQHFDLYCRMAQEVLSRSEDQMKSRPERGYDEAGYIDALRGLREVLFTVIQQPVKASRSESKSNKSAIGTLERLLLIVHYFIMHYVCRENDATDMAASLLVVLLHHVRDIPCDKIFYMAGMACKDAGWDSKGFIMLNHFLDLVEAIDDGGDSSGCDNTDFEKTNIPAPTEHPIPTSYFLNEDRRESTRDWILATAMEMSGMHEGIDQEWLNEIRSNVGSQLEHVVRRYDREGLAIQDLIRDVHERFG